MTGVSGERPQTLAGKSVVVTGTVEGFTREEAEAAIWPEGANPLAASPRARSASSWDRSRGGQAPEGRGTGTPVVDESRAFLARLETGEMPGGA